MTTESGSWPSRFSENLWRERFLERFQDLGGSGQTESVSRRDLASLQALQLKIQCSYVGRFNKVVNVSMPIIVLCSFTTFFTHLHKSFGIQNVHDLYKISITPITNQNLFVLSVQYKKNRLYTMLTSNTYLFYTSH